ncbi:MAG: hypothetical protein Q7J85_09440 [Bacillota bacterium]|nr:hypothetical protein [Bacillota bacterium]
MRIVVVESIYQPDIVLTAIDQIVDVVLHEPVKSLDALSLIIIPLLRPEYQPYNQTQGPAYQCNQ